jgi:hypothetical protein
VLPSIIGQMAAARGAEERTAWRRCAASSTGQWRCISRDT